MAKERKRIEAISEIFESEKSYINDMILWEKDFRMWILNYEPFGIKVRYEICDIIFSNMEHIRKLHQDILHDLHEENLKFFNLINGEKSDNKNNYEFVLNKNSAKNDILKKLDYSVIYNKHLNSFNIYLEYVKTLPKAENELERLMYNYEDFKNGVNTFMYNKNISFLGLKHFLYRPSQKIARYPLLFKAISKNEENTKIRKNIDSLIANIKAIASEVDKQFKEFSSQFVIYRLSLNLKYKEIIRDQQCLDLFHKKRKLIKEGTVLAKYRPDKEPKLTKVYVFDHIILICDFPEDKFSKIYICEEPIYISRTIVFTKDLGFYPTEDKLKKYHPLFIHESGAGKIRVFYFEDKRERDVYFSAIYRCIKKTKQNFRGDIKLEVIKDKPPTYMKNVCQANRLTYTIESSDEECEEVESDESSFSFNPTKDTIDEDSLSEIDTQELFHNTGLLRTMSRFVGREKTIRDMSLQGHADLIDAIDDLSSEESESDNCESGNNTNFVKQFFCGGQLFVKSVEFPLPLDRSEDPDYIRYQDDMYIIAGKDGMYKMLYSHYTKILDKKVKKVIYDPINEILIYQFKASLYVASFNNESDTIEEHVLKTDIGDFFYGNTIQGSYIASRNYRRGNKSSLIYLFIIKRLENSVKIELSRKLYVGFQVYSIFFLPEKIIIACKDFEIVDLDTLRTVELLETYDPCISVFFRSLEKTIARCVFAISKHTFLCCFDAIGILINESGRLKKTNTVFLWDCLPTEFRVIYDFIICLSKEIINVFDLKTGKMIFSKYQPNLKFVSGSYEPWLHDGKNFYRLEFNILKKAEEDIMLDRAEYKEQW